MKTKETFDSKNVCAEKINSKTKPKSFKPMRSMVALRSLKPKTRVATFSTKSLEEQSDITQTDENSLSSH
jgi:hypothetical protein